MRKFWKTYFSWDGLSAWERMHMFQAWVFLFIVGLFILVMVFLELTS